MGPMMTHSWCAVAEIRPRPSAALKAEQPLWVHAVPYGAWARAQQRVAGENGVTTGVGFGQKDQLRRADPDRQLAGTAYCKVSVRRTGDHCLKSITTCGQRVDAAEGRQGRPMVGEAVGRDPGKTNIAGWLSH